MNLVPSTDQIKGQLQILLPAVGAVCTAYGATKEAGYATTALLVAGPLSIIIGAAWSLFDRTRESIIRMASRRKDANTPAPQIILPAQESALADKLPDNVTAAPK